MVTVPFPHLSGLAAAIRVALDERVPTMGVFASGRLLALYLGSGHQMHDFSTVQHHAAPRTTSDLFYKGAVANSSPTRGDFNFQNAPGR